MGLKNMLNIDKKLNLGCGGFPKEEFINLDIRGDLDRIFRERDPHLHYIIKQWDLRSGLKDYQDNSIDAITESHTLMYLKVEEYNEIFKEIYRVLKIDGVLRITEDNCERPYEELKKDSLPWGNPDSVTGPRMMRKELSKVFVHIYDMQPEETMFIDKSLIQNLHGTPPRVFHIEAIKRRGQ
jgi:predicted SAM-dependent methyltransferase